MNKPRHGFVAVDSGLVGQTLVEAILAKIAQRPPPTPPDPVGAALDDPDQDLVPGDEARLEMALRHAGYLARVVEAEMFEPAKRPASWLGTLLRESIADNDDVAAAVAATSAKLAHAEPTAKPDPDDPAAATWRVPGPGGHVRHYVARRSIEDLLQGRDRPVKCDPAELKLAWTYGFFVRACEELLTRNAVGDVGL